MTPRNQLDGKVIIDRRLLETIRAILRTIDQCPTTLAVVNEALDQDLTGWVAVKENVIASQRMGGCRYPISQRRWQAMLAASPPLPQKEGE